MSKINLKDIRKDRVFVSKCGTVMLMEAGLNQRRANNSRQLRVLRPSCEDCVSEGFTIWGYNQDGTWMGYEDRPDNHFHLEREIFP